MPNKNDPPPPPVANSCMVLLVFRDEKRSAIDAGDATQWFFHVNGGKRVVGVARVAANMDWYQVPAAAPGELLMVQPDPQTVGLGCGRSLKTSSIRFLGVPGGYCCLDYPTETCRLSGFSFKAEKQRLAPGSKAKPLEGFSIRARYLGGSCVVPAESVVTLDCCGSGFIMAEAGLWQLCAEEPAGYKFAKGGKDLYQQICSGQVVEVDYLLREVATSVCAVLHDGRSRPLDNHKVTLCGPPMQDGSPAVEASGITAATGIATVGKVSPGRNRVSIFDNQSGKKLICNPDWIEVPPEGLTVTLEAREQARAGVIVVNFPTASGKNLGGPIEFVQLAPDGTVQRVLQTLQAGSDNSVKIQSPDPTRPLATYVMDKAFRVRGVVYPVSRYLDEPAPAANMALSIQA